MNARALASKLVATLPQGRPGLFNPWADRCENECATDGAVHRIRRLEFHLDCEPCFVLVGEAPGYQGCRYSGVAFTSERLLLEGAIPRIPIPPARLSNRKLPFSEPSATIVWKTLKDLGIEGETVLWNAVPLHPHDPHAPWTNRTPTASELALGRPALLLLRKAFGRAAFIPIGRKAEDLLMSAGICATACVRHPANGGAAGFARGLADVVRAA